MTALYFPDGKLLHLTGNRSAFSHYDRFSKLAINVADPAG